MRRMRTRALLGAVAAAVSMVLGCGPIGPLAGGRLGGEVVRGPVEAWDFARDESRAQLETRPADPHSVNTWFVGIGPRLYVPTSMILGPKEPSERSWVGHVAADPAVRIRIGGRVFERRAQRVEGDEYAQARRALEAKYEIAEADRDPERTIWIYRLDAR